VLSRGKELAFELNKGYLRLGMATGAAVYVGNLCELQDSPLDYRTNMVLSTEDGHAIFIVDCHNTQNQVSFTWSAEEPFDFNRGPDLADHTALVVNLTEYLTDSKYTKYFTVSNVFLSNNSTDQYKSEPPSWTVY
jgi:hypothetical protein